MTNVVLGLDGSAFELIDPWIADGSLPTLERIRSEGLSNDMQSCLPPVTCPNWQAYATGTNPGKLGVFWWEKIDANRETIESTSTSDQFSGVHFWRQFDDEVAIINLPTSYPPPDVDGVHIAGGPGSQQTGFTNPPELEQELLEQYGYAVHPSNMGELSVKGTESTCVREIHELIDARFDVLIDLLESGDYEFIHLTVFYINVLHHFFWDHAVVKKAWERIDERIAELLESPNLTNLFIMSDHGSNEIEVTFNVNAWLEREGYLETTSGVSDLLYRAGLTRERLRPVLAELKIEWLLRRLIPRRLQSLLPDDSGQVTQVGKAHVVDWEASSALASGQGPVYVLEPDSAERERICDELAAKLRSLDVDGHPVVDAVYPAAEIYDGPHVKQGPALLLDQAPGVHIEGGIGPEKDPFESPTRWRAENKDTGLFIAHGEDIAEEAALSDMHILDIAPTLVHLHGHPVPTNMDGSIRKNLFAEGSEAATRDPAYMEVSDDDDTERVVETDVSDRLQDLGYLS